MSRLAQLNSLLSESPGDEFILFAIAKEYEKLDNLKLSEEYYLKLKSINNQYVGLYYHLAKLYEELDNKSAALKIYDEGILIAKKLNDFHSLSELMNAKNNFELDF
jgi:tetratricopeptide (TPR) repeat protein